MDANHVYGRDFERCSMSDNGASRVEQFLGSRCARNSNIGTVVFAGKLPGGNKGNQAKTM